MKTTEHRLATLEREVRTYRTVLLSLVVGVGAVMMVAACQGNDQEKRPEKIIECDVLRAKRIELREV